MADALTAYIAMPSKVHNEQTAFVAEFHDALSEAEIEDVLPRGIPRCKREDGVLSRVMAVVG